MHVVYSPALVDPVDKSPLRSFDGYLESASGRRYPLIDGIPILLIEGIPQTIGLAEKTLRLAKAGATNGDPLWLDTTGMGDAKIGELTTRLAANGMDDRVDPVVSYLVGATSGFLYEHLAGRLTRYPIPHFPMPVGQKGDAAPTLLDVGCSWGRWSIAAARRGFRVVGIDPSLGAVLAARRVATQMQLPITWVVADARFLPFHDNAFDTVFSYSVIQHFSRDDAKRALREICRILYGSGKSMVQMPNAFGIRSFYHRWRSGFSEGTDFSVRYYTPSELRRTFSQAIGVTTIDVDGFFGLGLQPSDYAMMPLSYKIILSLSEKLRWLSRYVPVLKNCADSLYLTSHKLPSNCKGCPPSVAA